MALLRKKRLPCKGQPIPTHHRVFPSRDPRRPTVEYVSLFVRLNHLTH